MSVYFNIHSHKEYWDESTIRSKLQNIATAKKDSVWIHPNLDISESNVASRCLWSLAGKRFDCLRSLYDINPKLTAERLNLLGHAVKDNPELYNLFVRAAYNFTEITNHRIDYPIWNQCLLGQPALAQAPCTTPAAPAPLPQIVVEPPSSPRMAENVVIHEIHEHHHVSPPVVVVDHGFRPRPIQPVYVAPRHIAPPRVSPGFVAPRHVAPVAQAAYTPGGNQIPGTRNCEPTRPIHVPAGGVRVLPTAVHRAPVRQEPIRQQPAPRAPANMGGHVPVGARR